ncbi:hypothetical protein H5410_023667 [Solanum commersonii]|uniref:Uncharacterized protein n=1 Tax=Solanum commersonii TaxID=4109 RepID=A0A9J5ZI43_SOLCO|nr:hypothetical protein H5410_023667 [Solanum commersonii]
MKDKSSCINYLKSNPKQWTNQKIRIHIYRNTREENAVHKLLRLMLFAVASGLEGNLKVIKKDKGYASDTSDYDLKELPPLFAPLVTRIRNLRVGSEGCLPEAYPGFR